MRRLGSWIQRKLTFTLLGWEPRLEGIKPAAADVDVVVQDLRAFNQFEGILTNPSPRLKTSGGLVIYVKVAEHEYERKLEAYSVYRKLDPKLVDFNLDVFVRRVLRGVTLTEGIIRRAVIPEEVGGLKLLRIHLVSPEDIFLFKGVTSSGRSKDIDDILRLLEAGIDFDVVLKEVKAQKELIEPERSEWPLGLLFEKMMLIQKILLERSLRSSSLDEFINKLRELIRG